jgi:hypothetical protein
VLNDVDVHVQDLFANVIATVDPESICTLC